MSIGPISEIYRVFSKVFYDLVGFYEYYYNRQIEINYNNIPKFKEVIPIYGEISLPKYITYLSSLPIVARLNQIKQLSHTYLLYPGAVHTRYEHSLGVMYRCREIAEKINKENIYRFNDQEKIILDIASFLHDLGHPAWGHALDSIQGYVIGLLISRGLMPFTLVFKKLDTIITSYLISYNEQLGSALNEICSKEIKDSTLCKIFKDILIQIIYEEDRPFKSEIANTMPFIRRISTILGKYKGLGGIDADRLDWLIRDSHHCYLEYILSTKKCGDIDFNKFIDLNRSNNFKIGVKDKSYFFIEDDNFVRCVRFYREHIYKEVYESLGRAFADSILTRLAYASLNIIESLGSKIASNSALARAIMGYLLMPDDQILNYTMEILQFARQYHYIFDSESDVSKRFIYETSYLIDLLGVALKRIVQFLNYNAASFISIMNMNYLYYNLEFLNLTLILFTASNLSILLKELFENYNDAEALAKIERLIINMEENIMNALNIKLLEHLVNNLGEYKEKFRIYILPNFYFVRKYRDHISGNQEIYSIEALCEYLKSNETFKNEPVLFIIVKPVIKDQSDIRGIIRDIYRILHDSILNKILFIK